MLSFMSLDHRDYMRAGPQGRASAGLPRWNAFQWVFAANVAVFVLQWLFRIGWIEDPLSGRALMPMGGVSLDELSRGHIWTLGTYMFVHGSPGHVLVNLIFLWFAGRRVQELYGSGNFLLIHFMSGLAGAVLQMAVGSLVLNDTSSPLIGASACCMGHLLAYALAMPREELTLLLFFIVPLRVSLRGLARFLLLTNIGLGLLECLGMLPDWLSGGSAVAYWAHVGGALAGWYGARSTGREGPIFRSRQPLRPVRRRLVASRPMGVPPRRMVEPAVEAPEVDTLRDEVDGILDKISAHGLESLTEQERRILELASRRMSGDA
jgi:membrane associated rhomboid family serine protease